MLPRSANHMDTAKLQSETLFIPEAVDPAVLDLSRLLSRLEHKILSTQGSAQLRRSPYERQKTNANLEHARTLLLSLEHRAPTSKTTASAAKAELLAQRRQLKTLQQRLYELSEPDPSGVVSEDEDDEDEEDLIARYAPARKDTHDTLDYDRGAKSTLTPEQASTAAAAAATLSNTLRARGGQTRAGDGGAAATTGVTTGSDSRAAPPTKSPFAPAKQQGPGPDASTTQLMEHHESEQDALTESLVTLAKALKDSTLSFSESLTGSNPILDAAAKALDKNVVGMEGASERMGRLRKLSSGSMWWWNRLGLYAQIAVLWVAIILVVFALPKLRFSSSF